MLNNSTFWHGRLKAASIHLAISLTLAALAALLVFLIWYPYPYREISGGRELFLIVVAVDVVMGPLLTLAVFNLNKSRKALRLDLAAIGVLQLAALAYGLWTVSLARPVHLVFVVDRFDVVHAVDVNPSTLEKAPAPLQRLPLWGPTRLTLRNYKDAKEKTDVMFAEVSGVSVATRPEFWQSYDKGKPQVLAKAKPVTELKARFPARWPDIQSVISQSHLDISNIGFLPLKGRNQFWTVIIDLQTAEPLGYLPLDPY
jgi:hypothetical protein